MKGIYFWDYKAVAKRLYNGDFSEVEALKQLIALLIISGISVPVPLSFYVASVDKPILLYVFGFMVSGVICYLGYWWVYQAHEKVQGRNFFLKLAALELPIGIRLLVLVLIPLFLLTIPVLQVFTFKPLAQVLGLFISSVAAIIHFKMLKSSVCYTDGQET